MLQLLTSCIHIYIYVYSRHGVFRSPFKSQDAKKYHRHLHKNGGSVVMPHTTGLEEMLRTIGKVYPLRNDGTLVKLSEQLIRRS